MNNVVLLTEYNKTIEVTNYASYALIINNPGDYFLEFKLAKDANVDIKMLTLLNTGSAKIHTTLIHEGHYSISNLQADCLALGTSKIEIETIAVIKEGVKGSQASQIAKGLAFKDAEITAKPILLIDSFDTKAYHGAFIGSVSDNDLLYLMSRGLPKEEATKLILKGIMSPYLALLSETEQTKLIKTMGGIV